MEFEIILSKRRTLGVEIKHGRVIVRAPYLANKRKIERFVAQLEGWIEKHLALE